MYVNLWLIWGTSHVCQSLVDMGYVKYEIKLKLPHYNVHYDMYTGISPNFMGTESWNF